MRKDWFSLEIGPKKSTPSSQDFWGSERLPCNFWIFYHGRDSKYIGWESLKCCIRHHSQRSSKTIWIERKTKRHVAQKLSAQALGVWTSLRPLSGRLCNLEHYRAQYFGNLNLSCWGFCDLYPVLSCDVFLHNLLCPALHIFRATFNLPCPVLCSNKSSNTTNNTFRD